MSNIPADLHQVICETVQAVRERLGAENIGRFSLTIRASGHTETNADSVKIEYGAASDIWSDGTVKGDKLADVVEEVVRRENWKNRHAPLALASPEEVA